MLYLTLRQYEYIAAVARAGSLAAAAAQLNVSQPSLSVALSQVEARLGRKLFHRGKGLPVRPTPAGETYLSAVEVLLAQARRLEDPGRHDHAVTGRLTLGIFDDLAPFHLCPILTALGQAMPDIEVRHRTGNFETLAREMLEGRIDLAVSYDLGLDASFSRTPLMQMRPHALVAANTPLACDPSVALQGLARHPLILFEEGLSVRHMLGLFRKIGARPEVRHKVGSLELMRSLAANGAGIGISYGAPDTGTSYDGRRVVAVPISDRFAEEPVVLVQAAAPQTTEVVTLARSIITANYSNA